MMALDFSSKDVLPCSLVEKGNARVIVSPLSGSSTTDRVLSYVSQYPDSGRRPCQWWPVTMNTSYPCPVRDRMLVEKGNIRLYLRPVGTECEDRQRYPKAKRLLLAICFMALACACLAQDLIVTKEDRRILARVTEVNETNIRYEKFSYFDGLVYDIPKADIDTIIYYHPKNSNLTVEKSYNNNLIRELTKQGNKVYIITEYADPAENDLKTMEQTEEQISSAIPTVFANAGYWEIVCHIDDADFVVCYTMYHAYGYRENCYGTYCWGSVTKIFDNQMNFIFALPPLYGLLVSPKWFKYFFIHLQEAHISKMSPFYVESKKVKRIDDVKFDKYYRLLLESIEYRQNEKILEYVDQCIKANPEFAKLYEIKSAVLIEMNKKSFKTVNKLAELDPLNPNLVLLSQCSEAQMQSMEWSVVGASLNPAATAMQLASNTSTYQPTTPTYHSTSSATQSSTTAPRTPSTPQYGGSSSSSDDYYIKEAERYKRDVEHNMSIHERHVRAAESDTKNGQYDKAETERRHAKEALKDAQMRLEWAEEAVNKRENRTKKQSKYHENRKY